EDLYYRLAVVRLEVPPLRERPEDVPALVAHLLARHAGEGAPKVSPEALEELARQPWPGNVRELENALQRALVLAEGTLGPADLGLGAGSEAPTSLDLKAETEALERRLVTEALRRTEGNKTQAAELLGLSRYGLQKKLKRMGLG
ncbi:MAG TPA: helix-turn-helix domain-containing protein, partial [Polyangiaceae bacterium LLY-WYZ-15_(1-7)]|nr:helix-turn-helix domain-containing protein [Polyangiaceae bacterium LLY-WYZ-15_(1-7)]